MSNKRVVITGIGVLTPIGNSITEFEKSLREGKSGIAKIKSFNTSELLHKNGGEL
ncbi:MAG: hypothetical protein GY861_13365, partial [bacterium]|nr:hypothetical protein [bacterium]